MISRRTLRSTPLCAALLLAAGLVLPAAAQTTAPAGEGRDRHAGYYYPEPTSRETYVARSQVLPEAERRARIAFVTGFTAKQLARPGPPAMALFAKGAEAQKLIIVSLEANRLNTLYRMRGQLAIMTAIARSMPIFQEYGAQDWFTFFDLAKMLGFAQITVSDGDRFAHQIFLE